MTTKNTTQSDLHDFSFPSNTAVTDIRGTS